jgi:hypothetical protein
MATETNLPSCSSSQLYFKCSFALLQRHLKEALARFRLMAIEITRVVICKKRNEFTLCSRGEEKLSDTFTHTVRGQKNKKRPLVLIPSRRRIPRVTYLDGKIFFHL